MDHLALPMVMPTGMHYPPRTKSVTIDLQYTASAGQPSTGTSIMSNPHGPSPSVPQLEDLNSEPGTGSNDQMELSRYKRLYSQAREDLDKQNGQAKRRYVNTAASSVCAHRNNLLGKQLAGHSWDVAYESSSLCLTIYQQSSTSMTYTASYVRTKLMKRTKNLQILK
jgi:hypothetical protein